MSTMSMRLSDDERKQIKAKSEQAGLSLSEYCRRVALDYEVPGILPNREIAKLLCEYHNRIEDAATLAEEKMIFHELEERIYGYL